MDLTTLLCTLVQTLPEPSSEMPVKRLIACGEQLERVGSLPAGDFDTFTATEVRTALGQRIEELESVLSCGLEESPFRRDVGTYVTALRITCARRDLAVPLDLRLSRTEEEARDLTQRLVLRFGQLLRHWPTILQLACRLPPPRGALTILNDQ